MELSDRILSELFQRHRPASHRYQSSAVRNVIDGPPLDTRDARGRQRPEGSPRHLARWQGNHDLAERSASSCANRRLKQIVAIKVQAPRRSKAVLYLGDRYWARTRCW